MAQWLGIVANAATAGALIFAIIQMRGEHEREIRQKRLEIYNQLNDQYVSFLQVAVAYPWVDCFDSPLEKPRTPEHEDEIRQEQVAFAVLTALLERAYVFYQRELSADDPLVLAQWGGWAAYAVGFSKRDRFLITWDRIKSGFDRDFVAWFDELRPKLVKSG